MSYDAVSAYAGMCALYRTNFPVFCKAFLLTISGQHLDLDCVYYSQEKATHAQSQRVVRVREESCWIIIAILNIKAD